jgi:predicted dehydrogenase
MMRFEGGATAYLEASNMARIPMPHWYITGTEGCIKGDTVGGEIDVVTNGDGEAERVEPVKRNDELYDNLIAACRGEAEPLVTPAHLRDSMALIDAIFRSAREGSAAMLISDAQQ